MSSSVGMPAEHSGPSVYFTAMWLQKFNKELVLERLDLVEEYINEAYIRFNDSKFNNLLHSEIDCITHFLQNECLNNPQYKFTDD